MKRDILKFLPLLLLYLLLVLMFSSSTFQGDEGKYVRSAIRLSQGYNWEVTWMGPGYSIVLIPFVLLNLPWLAAKLLNAFFLFGSILYLYKTLNLYIEKKYATIFTILLGLYPPFMREIHFLITECLVFFLVCGFTFHFCSSQKISGKSRFHLLAASIYLGYLALTKVFFGYVILFGLLSFLILFIWRRTSGIKKITYIYLMALIWCTPYLLLTYSQTGKVFYWATSGGMQLYWMSTSYSTHELGSWYSSTNVMEFPELAPHRAFFQKITGLSGVEKDDAFKKQAIENIIHNPKIYFINWVANIGRLLFSYPYSFNYAELTTFFYLIPNMFIVVLFALSIYPAILRWKSIPYEICALLFFDFIAFGGTSLVSAYDRQFRPLVPILLIWLSFMCVRVLKIEFRTKDYTK